MAEAFGLAMGMGMQSPFTGLTAEAFDEMRALVIALVLATVSAGAGRRVWRAHRR